MLLPSLCVVHCLLHVCCDGRLELATRFESNGKVVAPLLQEKNHSLNVLLEDLLKGLKERRELEKDPEMSTRLELLHTDEFQTEEDIFTYVGKKREDL